MLYVGVDPLQHPLTGVLIRQVWLNLETKPARSLNSSIFVFAVTLLFTLIAVFFPLVISSDEIFYCRILQRLPAWKPIRFCFHMNGSPPAVRRPFLQHKFDWPN